MLAIPISEKNSTTISDLFGNVPYFALLDTDTGMFTVVENEVKGQGPQSADFLKQFGTTSTVFYHMGDGVYKAFVKNGMDVYTSNHTFSSIDLIYREWLNATLIKLDESNYKELLDPGNGGACKCGCEN